MVYESDFYTTRRPYSRPLATSYTVTSPSILPLSSVIQVRTYPHLPYVAHKRLVTFVHTPIHSVYHTGTPIPIRIHSRVRPSVLAAEYNRIRDLPRSSSKSYTERYLNSKDSILFDDETRQIRAKADSLLRRIHVYVPRPAARYPAKFIALYYSDYHDEIVPERLRSDDYIRRLLGARKNIQKEIELASWYTVPEQRTLGSGHLACVEYVGGKPHSRRRPYYKLADLRPSDVRSDVNLLSYYSKNREAAANASPASPLTEREIRKARAVEPEWTPAPPQKAASPPPEPEEPAVIVEEEEPEVVVPEPKKEKKEKKKEKDVKKIDEEARRRAEEFLAKQAEEARLEEERRIAAEKERLRLEREEEEARIALEKAKEEARLAAIAEQERLEAERKAEEERLEILRVEAARIAAEERAAYEAAAVAEEERYAQKAAEEELNRKTEEERLAAEVAAIADAAAALETSKPAEMDEDELHETDQDLEERQVEVVVEEEAQIGELEGEAEEEAEEDTGVEAFVEEPVEVEGAGAGDNQAEEPVVEDDAAVIEEVPTSGGAETTDDIWGNDEDA